MQTIESININGPAGNIEAIYHPGSENSESSDYLLIICHPNSVQGGSMDNKVVTTIQRSAVNIGMAAVRFNFRGVGQSEGQYDNGNGEQQDLLAVINHILAMLPDKKIVVAGFSFGSYVSYQVTKQREDIAGLLLVAPAIHMWDYGKDDLSIPRLVIHGKDDEIADFQNTVEWIQGFENKPNLILLENTSHFFHGKLLDLKEHTTEFLKNIST